MGVTERVTFSEDFLHNRTKVNKEVWIDSQIVGLRSAIRKFGIDRFKKNCVLATSGFDWAISQKFGLDGNQSPNKKHESAQLSGHQNTQTFGGKQLRQ